jgi:hypothetical protein
MSALAYKLIDVRSKLADLKEALLPNAFARIYREVEPYTMCSRARLRALHDAVQYVLRDGIPGDIVECGSAAGGSAALMDLMLKDQPDRLLWVFDTFEGLPPPTREDPSHARSFVGTCRGDLAELAPTFGRLNLLDRARFIKGLFQDTVLGSAVRAIAVLHLDCDWYDSVKICLNHLYDRISPGGVVQIDDYGHWEGARKAVDEFVNERGLRIPLRYLDYSGRQLIRPSDGDRAGSGV